MCCRLRLDLRELRKKSGGYAAHFLNGTGTEMHTGKKVTHLPTGETWPAIKKDIVFTMQREKIKTAYAVSPDFTGRKPLQVTYSGGKSKIILPKELLKSYTIVHME